MKKDLSIILVHNESIFHVSQLKKRYEQLKLNLINLNKKKHLECIGFDKNFILAFLRIRKLEFLSSHQFVYSCVFN